MMYIPPQHIELERVHSGLLSDAKRTLAVTSADSGEGVSSMALALAHRSLLAGRTTLLVDLNLHRPSLERILGFGPRNTDSQPELLPKPRLVTNAGHNLALSGITAPTSREAILGLRVSGVLEQSIVEWQREFDTIIFDTSPLNRINAGNIPAERVAAACDGALLMVLAGHTTENKVSAALDRLNSAGAEVLGCVINDRDNPPLKQELLREVQRLEQCCRGAATRLKGWIDNSQLLSLEI